MPLCDYLANAWLDDLFGIAAYTPPANIYVGLSTADPGADGLGVSEPSGGSYARVSTSSSDWTAAASRQVANANDIAFATPTGSWGDITYVFLADAASGGNILVSAALPGAVEIIDGSTPPTFVAGNLVFSIAE